MDRSSSHGADRQAALSATQVFVDQKNYATATAMSLSSTATALAFPSFPQNQTSITGKWYWEQSSGPYHGYFYITQSGNTFSGTLDDVYEGTYNDKVIDGIINGSSFSFTRDGRYGIQFWYGTLDTNNGLLEINNGLWQKQGWPGDDWLPFYAKLIEPDY